MYARQSQPIGLSGLLDTIKDLTGAAAMTYLQFKGDKQLQKEQDAETARQRELLEYQRQLAAQGTKGGFDLGGMTMPIIIGVGALGLFFFMRK